ncbi:hypothetical protein K503DRAFT_765316 [Rhizopogon vinicolor AM-OR11-026]|uniref:THO1-MOS11 C-terminal domain-containing protein n=1 Tax=Rhizopogon vinicolor AM-OR11-026 TaxID=1314800 RepID=A0A1B7NH14_9AGAM|nr:hypothetical protein K503DRAFT_765316 [Rhizopogon vinicolor AM-OR11-026]
MDSKLKSLKVPELKEILSKASIPPGNAKKQDLINKILANPPAIDIFHTLYPNTKPSVTKQAPPPPNDDLLAPPEEVDWTVEEATPVVTPTPTTPKQPPASPPKSSSTSKQPPATVPAPATAHPPSVQSTSTETPTSTDEEAAKRKARAARFNIDYVEPTKSSQQRQKKEKISTASPREDPIKLQSRAERFGTSTTKTTTRKRAAPVEQVDPEEQERRRKRAERFGTISDTKA